MHLPLRYVDVRIFSSLVSTGKRNCVSNKVFSFRTARDCVGHYLFNYCEYSSSGNICSVKAVPSVPEGHCSSTYSGNTQTVQDQCNTDLRTHCIRRSFSFPLFFDDRSRFFEEGFGLSILFDVCFPNDLQKIIFRPRKIYNLYSVQSTILYCISKIDVSLLLSAGHIPVGK